MESFDVLLRRHNLRAMRAILYKRQMPYLLEVVVLEERVDMKVDRARWRTNLRHSKDGVVDLPQP